MAQNGMDNTIAMTESVMTGVRRELERKLAKTYPLVVVMEHPTKTFYIALS